MVNILTGENANRRFKVQLKHCQLASVHIVMVGTSHQNVMQCVARVACNILPRGEHEV